MADGIVKSKFVLSIAPDASGVPGVYVDYSVDSASFNPSGGEKARGSQHTAGRVNPRVGIGKPSPIEWTVKVLYGEAATDLARVLRGYFDNETLIHIKYQVNSGGADWEGGPGYITDALPPEGDAESGDLMTTEFLFFGEGESVTYA